MRPSPGSQPLVSSSSSSVCEPRRVLELVDEQVLDAPVEREQQLGRLVDAAESALTRAGCRARRSRSCARLRTRPELGSEVQQHDAQRHEMAAIADPCSEARAASRPRGARRERCPRSADARVAASAWRSAAACAGPKPSFLRSCLRQSPFRVSSSRRGGAPRRERALRHRGRRCRPRAKVRPRYVCGHLWRARPPGAAPRERPRTRVASRAA